MPITGWQSLSDGARTHVAEGKKRGIDADYPVTKRILPVIKLAVNFHTKTSLTTILPLVLPFRQLVQLNQKAEGYYI